MRRGIIVDKILSKTQNTSKKLRVHRLPIDNSGELYPTVRKQVRPEPFWYSLQERNWCCLILYQMLRLDSIRDRFLIP
jgi:hypothetical protein